MTTTHKKTPAGATNTNEGKNEIGNLSNTDHPTPLAHLIRPGKSDAVSHRPFHGGTIPRKNCIALFTSVEQVRQAYEGDGLTVCPECVRTQSHEYHERKRREQQKQAQRDAADKAAKEKEVQERVIIKEITGQSLSRLDLPIFLADDYRAGKDVTPWLDAIKALDDADLARAGRTSWSDTDE